MAESSLSVALFTHVQLGAQCPVKALKMALGGKAVTLGCGAQAAPLTRESLHAALAQGGAVLVCGGQKETEALQMAVQAARDGKAVAVYLSAPEGQEETLGTRANGMSSGRRRLQSKTAMNGSGKADYVCVPFLNGQYSAAGARCYTQVKVIEGVIVLLVLFAGTAWGLALLGWLQAPTRFETPKDKKDE